ncbi:MAG: twin-arginine translocation signal domain-containing protein [Phycisphaerales bacterium]|nr:MAG: twin-arginine translocation signal domain-containing protein [Phycisphaerales bacterium]
MSIPNLPGYNQFSRRQFLKRSGLLAVAAIAAEQSVRVCPSPAEAKLPQIKFGKYSLSRLICGTNPFNGGSHLSIFVNQAMREYYTEEQILRTLGRCQQVGINCWQAGYANCKLYQRLVEQGGRMHYLAIGHEQAQIKDFLAAGTIGLAHHGERTDRAFKAGQLDGIEDYLKRVRDAGLMVGVSTHMPAVIEEVESRGWDVDYYMACVYERHRSAAELEKLLGQAPIPVGEVYLPNDPPRMFKVMRQTKRPCLAFKILAAGRLSKKKAWVEKAFRETFKSIKPNDAVIVGIYDRYSDQLAENAAYTRRFCST